MLKVIFQKSFYSLISVERRLCSSSLIISFIRSHPRYDFPTKPFRITKEGEQNKFWKGTGCFVFVRTFYTLLHYEKIGKNEQKCVTRNIKACNKKISSRLRILAKRGLKKDKNLSNEIHLTSSFLSTQNLSHCTCLILFQEQQKKLSQNTKRKWQVWSEWFEPLKY